MFELNVVRHPFGNQSNWTDVGVIRSQPQFKAVRMHGDATLCMTLREASNLGEVKSGGGKFVQECVCVT